MRLQAGRRRLRDQVLDEEEVVGCDPRSRVRASSAASWAWVVAFCGALSSCGTREGASAVVVDVEPVRAAPDASSAPNASATVSARVAALSSLPRGSIVWSHDLEQAWADAERGNKPLLVYVRAAWSTAGLEMERETLTSEVAGRASRPYVAVYVDITDDDVLARTEARLGVPIAVVPITFLIDVRSDRRSALEGYKDVDAFAEGLSAFVSGK
ncbi:MAG: hypothetical protein HOW73_45010 [Polyangiaceae bacterium]|nr:hypothetical protein [Polyangiaceae bacterium]